jgi:hypothetical protein
MMVFYLIYSSLSLLINILLNLKYYGIIAHKTKLVEII